MFHFCYYTNHFAIMTPSPDCDIENLCVEYKYLWEIFFPINLVFILCAKKISTVLILFWKGNFQLAIVAKMLALLVITAYMKGFKHISNYNFNTECYIQASQKLGKRIVYVKVVTSFKKKTIRKESVKITSCCSRL